MRVATVVLTAIGVAAGAAFPALAAQGQPAPAAAAARALAVPGAEGAALQALQAAASGFDRPAQDAALAAARAAVRSADGRYALGYYQLQIGQARQDAQLVGQAVDMLLESGQAPAADQAQLLVNQASRAYYGGDIRRADRLLDRAVELQPGSPVVLADSAQIKARLGERPAAVTLLQRAIELQRGAGQAVPESWYQRALALAVEGRLAPQSVALARELVANYPNPVNWRDALLVYRDFGGGDPALALDIGRLMRATQALAGERDYMQLAEAFNAASLPGEAKAILDEGSQRGMLNGSEAAVRQLVTATTRRATADRSGLARRRTQALAAAGTAAQALSAADAHFGFGEYAQAAELYRAALQKGGQDADLINSRLGAALALAGQRAEAEAALQAVTGPRSHLAGFWLAWLARRAG